MPKPLLRREQPKRLVLHFSHEPNEGAFLAGALSEAHGRSDLRIVQVTHFQNVPPDLVRDAEAISLSFPTASQAIPFLQAVFKHRPDVPALGIFLDPAGVTHLKQHYSLKTALTLEDIQRFKRDPLRALALEIHRRLPKQK